jgi:hypothetical protein
MNEEDYHCITIKDEVDLDCPICLNLLEKGDIIEVPCCNKNFHRQCYLECMKQKKECPMCRQDNTSYAVSLFPELNNSTQLPSIHSVLPIYTIQMTQPTLSITIPNPHILYARSIIPMLGSIILTVLLITSLCNNINC